MTESQARQNFPALMRRGHVIELGRRIGIAEYSVRALIEGDQAPIKGIVYPRTCRKYFNREEVLHAMFTHAQRTA